MWGALTGSHVKAEASELPKQELSQSRSDGHGNRGSSPDAAAQRWVRCLERVAGPSVRVLGRRLGQGLGGETSEEAAPGSWGEK